VPYALGLAIGKYRGLRTISHGGSDAGYRSNVVWFPDQGIGIAVLSNLATFNAGGISNQVAAVYLGNQMTPEPAKPKVEERKYITLAPAATELYVGHYRLADLLIQVTTKDGKLMATPPGSPPLELKPFSAARFYAEQMQAELEFTPKAGAAMGIKLTRVGGTVEGERVTFAPFDVRDMEKYPGTYWSDELETQYTFLIRDGKLFADHSHHGEIALTPTAKDQFRSSTWFMPEVKFTRDAAGKVTGVTVGGNRVSGLKFVRR